MKFLIIFVIIICMFILLGCPVNQKFSPTIQKISGPDGNVYMNSQIFEWLGSDTDGTIAGYEYRKDGVGWLTTAATEFTWNSITLGSHTFEVRAKDNEDTYSNIIIWNFSYKEISVDWQKSFGGSDYDFAKSIQQTTDGGYIVTGYTESNDGDVSGNHGENDYWVVKISEDGSLTWQKCLGGSNSDYAYSIQQTTDGGYINAGYTDSNDADVSGNNGGNDYWIVKIEDDSSLTWEKSLGGSDHDFANSIQQTTDGGYIVAGDSFSDNGDVSGNHGNNDYWVVKLDDDGSLTWQKSLGGSDYDFAKSIQQTTDGGYIVAGYSLSNDGDVSGNNGNWDYWITKLDSNGNLDWQKSLGGSNSEYAYSVQQTTDGGYIVAGYTYSNDGDVSGNHGNSDYWVVKLNSNGNIDWQKCFGGSSFDYTESIQQTTDGGYIVAGYSTSNDGDVSGNHGNNDYWVVKLYSNGSIDWQKSLGGSNCDVAYSIQQTTDGGYIVAGYSTSNDGDVSGNHGDEDYWIVKISDNQ